MLLSFSELARSHQLRYPHIEVQDFVKLAYQSEFGPAHLLRADPEQVAYVLSEEWRHAPPTTTPAEPEDIGGGLCRFPLHAEQWSPDAAERLMRYVRETAACCCGTVAGLEEKLERLTVLSISGLQAYLPAYRQAGYPAVHHSAAYNAAYHPHYRLLRQDYADALWQWLTRNADTSGKG